MKSRVRRTVADYRKLPAETVVRRRSTKPIIAHRITINAPDYRNGSTIGFREEKAVVVAQRT